MGPGSESNKRRGRLVLALSTGAVAVPILTRGVAWADAPGSQPVPGGHELSSLPAVLSLCAAVFAVAFLTNRFAPKKRRHIRDTSLPALFYLAAFVAAEALSALGAHGAARVARELSAFFGLLTAINLGVLLIFDLGLSALHVAAAPFLGGVMV